MRIMITGGTGLIGRALTDNLTRAGHEVIILTRNPTRGIHTTHTNVKFVGWDGSTSDGWGHLVEGIDAIVNLAGESIAGDSMVSLITKRWSRTRLNTILQSRLNAGRAVIDAIQQANRKPAVLVQASAVGFYGSRGDELLTEGTPAGTDQIAQLCSQWENSTINAESMGVRRVIIRSGGVVMSTSGGAFPFMLLPFRLFAGGPLGSGKSWFSWIHFSDEAKAIRYLIENTQASGVYNLCAPQNVTNREFSQILGKVMHRPSIFPMPAFALYLIFGEKASLLLASQRQVPNRLTDLGFRFDFPKIEGALIDLLRK